MCVLCVSVPANAGSLEMAKRIHDRIAGVPATAEVLLRMQAAIDADAVNGGAAAARIAMDHENFYKTTLKNWVAPWTNREQSAFVEFNDYIATVIGVVRDDIDYRSSLYADILYTADASLGLTPYSVNNNRHYIELENGDYSLRDNLVRQSQAAITGLPLVAVSGVITSRAAAKSFFIAGTNRAMFRFTLLNHLCMDLEQVNDITRVPDRIRQDVSRSPGGDARVFLNSCAGCHSGMDPLAQAFAYHNFEYDADSDLTGENGRLVYNAAGDTDPETGTRVQAKYHINASTFPYGFITPDDRWDNYWREGQNKSLGWAPIGGDIQGYGNGAASMLKELAHSQAFAHCAVEKVFKAVCLREPGDGNDRAQVASMVDSFNSEPILRNSFAAAANYCKGE
ncbi:MAG: hypothetical protein KTR17_06825 [Cellvibrionaceae bacterium]|nr:hypothetical protein [Cellvibrionaceae bacterium]